MHAHDFMCCVWHLFGFCFIVFLNNCHRPMAFPTERNDTYFPCVHKKIQLITFYIETEGNTWSFAWRSAGRNRKMLKVSHV